MVLGSGGFSLGKISGGGGGGDSNGNRGSGVRVGSVVQVVFLFGSETWVLTPHMGQTLGGFQHRAAIGCLGKQPRRLPNGGFIYPPPPFGGRNVGHRSEVS